MALKANFQVMLADGGGGSRKTSTPQVYDPTTGKWRDSAVTLTPSVYDPTSSQFRPPISDKKTSTSTGSTSSTTKGTSQTDQKTEADKEYIEYEFNILTGELVITSTEKTIRINVNDTVKLEGLGNYLSGQYFVKSVKRSLSKDGGYTHSLNLIKNGFGNSVKKAVEIPVPVEEPRKEEVPKPAPELKVGDTVKIVGDNAVYSNASDGVRVPNWVKQKTHTIRQISDDKNRVLLKEIFSWTYVKFIQKV